MSQISKCDIYISLPNSLAGAINYLFSIDGCGDMCSYLIFKLVKLMLFKDFSIFQVFLNYYDIICFSCELTYWLLKKSLVAISNEFRFDISKITLNDEMLLSLKQALGYDSPENPPGDSQLIFWNAL